ncbi:hypothetical protein GTA51_18055 [Desulfovibrio aerotolerans]|uniref:Uncharacterized protein n=1 Tax=Solidesulfovibrio aerotolerans TaxID=295255 RepID=A0A7C9JBE8_9BACT|nr:hypothetical protein [Solidesulfovibrio aerotolerans]MYL85018.1 hypothetical protein [Solidesulfovibrio aerotolerans]
MSEANADDLAQAVLDTVREASAAMRLIAADEILEQLLARGVATQLPTPPEANPCLLLAAILAGLPGIAALNSLSGRPVYHDLALLSRTYARILDRKDATEVLLAEEIRSNSRDYPRPVPVELFEKTPFNLAPETIAAALKTLSCDQEFQDITSLTTAAGAVYLFSTLYLKRGYAVFLAEQEASLAGNP